MSETKAVQAALEGNLSSVTAGEEKSFTIFSLDLENAVKTLDSKKKELGLEGVCMKETLVLRNV